MLSSNLHTILAAKPYYIFQVLNLSHHPLSPLQLLTDMIFVISDLLEVLIVEILRK